MSSQNTDYIITTGTVDAQGNQSYTTKTPVENADKRTDKQKAADKRTEMLAKLGVYSQFLKDNPDIADLIKRAVADYANGNEWTDQKFQSEYSATQFAKDRTKAQEEFDLGMGGANADSYQKKVADYSAALTQSALRLGINLTPEEAQAQATAAVRSDLKQTDIDAFWQTQYMKGTEKGGPSQIGGKAIAGTAGSIQSQLKTMAGNYGLKMDDTLLRQKTGEALGQGERWQEWMQGQEGYFKEQAKLLFPKAAGLLDKFNLKQIAEPYFSDAADLLGVSPEQMDLTDPKWTGFLNGANGPLSRDEWTRVLMTDPKYGWDKTTKARQRFAGVGDELLSAFGMA